jgi:hypothetical protein
MLEQIEYGPQSPEQPDTGSKAEVVVEHAGALRQVLKAIAKHDAAIRDLKQKALQLAADAQKALEHSVEVPTSDADALSPKHQFDTLTAKAKGKVSEVVSNASTKAQQLLERGTTDGIKADFETTKQNAKQAALNAIKARQDGDFDIAKNLGEFRDRTEKALIKTGDSIKQGLHTSGETYDDVIHDMTSGIVHGAVGVAHFLENAAHSLRTKLEDGSKPAIKAVDNTLSTGAIKDNLARLKDATGDAIKSAEDASLGIIAQVVEDPSIVAKKVDKTKQKARVNAKLATKKTKKEVKSTLDKRLSKQESDNHSELYHETLKEINTYLAKFKSKPIIQITQLVELEGIFASKKKISKKTKDYYRQLVKKALTPQEALKFQTKNQVQQLEQKAIITAKETAKGFVPKPNPKKEKTKSKKKKK